jgi:hypothetical protein
LTGFMLNLADPFVLRYYWRQWDARQLRLILPTALVGILLGTPLGRGQRYRRAHQHRLGRGQFGRHHYRALSGRARALECRGGSHRAGALVAANCLKVVSYWTIGFLT